MTREQAIKALKWFKEYNEEDYCGGDRIQDEHGDWYYRITEQDFEAFDVAIKALEQETVSKEVYDHEYFLRKEFELKIDELQRQLEEQAVKAESILDNIRAEIKALSPEPTAYDVVDGNPIKDAVWETIADVLKILDKYKSRK